MNGMVTSEIPSHQYRYPAARIQAPRRRPKEHRGP
jgi:hypothetical protein